MDQNIDDLALQLNIPLMDTKQVVEDLKHDMLLSLYRKNPGKPKHLESFNIEMNQKVAEVYKEWYGFKFNPKVHEKNKIKPRFLMGLPGQGKTAAYEDAASQLCAAMNLNLVTDVTDDYIPEPYDFLMVVHESAGETSALTYGGLPNAAEVEIRGEKEKVLKKLVNYRFTLFKHCAGGVLLFDDAANAGQMIQNVFLPVAQKNTFQGTLIPNALIGFTGNLGSLDGTNTSEQSSALLTRVLSCFVRDNIANFCERAEKKYNDSLGDLGYLNYLRRCNDESVLSSLPEQGSKGGHPCSRAHESALQEFRSLVERFGGRGVGEEKAIPFFSNVAIQCIGTKEGRKLAAYMEEFFHGADPLAYEYIMDGKPNNEKLAELYSGGSGMKDLAFGYQFATACGDYTVNLISESDNPKEKLPEAIKRFGIAALQLDDSAFAYAIEYLKGKMSSVITDFSTPVAKGPRELTNDIRTVIAIAINDLEDCGESRRNLMIEVITDMDKLQNPNMFAKTKGKGRQMSF